MSAGSVTVRWRSFKPASNRNSTPLPRWGVELEGDRLIRVKADMSTSVRGIYACGDMVSYPGKDKRIVTGCGEAVTAVLSVDKYLKQPYWALGPAGAAGARRARR